MILEPLFPTFLYCFDVPNHKELNQDLDKVISGVDLIIIATDHNEYKEITEEYIIKKAKKNTLVFDGRNILDNKKFNKLNIITIGK